jgi:hypothetical protein
MASVGKVKRSQVGLSITVILLAIVVLVGTLDIIFARLYWASVGSTVPRLFQAIASGIMGPSSRSAGMTSVILGAVCHYFIVSCMALAYYMMSRALSPLVKHPIPFGIAYGLFLYAFMNLVVLPLSAAGMPSFSNRPWVLSSVAMHCVFGVIFAFGARMASFRRVS